MAKKTILSVVSGNLFMQEHGCLGPTVNEHRERWCGTTSHVVALLKNSSTSQQWRLPFLRSSQVRNPRCHTSIQWQLGNLSFVSVLLFWFCNKDSILCYHDCVSMFSIGFLSFVSFWSAVRKIYTTFFQLRFLTSLDMLCSNVCCSCNAHTFIRRARTGLCCLPESSGLQTQTFASLFLNYVVML